MYAKGTHSRNARETQHGRLAQASQSSLPVSTLQRQYALCLLSSLHPFRSLFLSAFSRHVFKEYSLVLCLLYSRIYAYRCITIRLRFCTMLLLSLRRFLAFCSMLFPRSSFLHLSYSLLLFFVSYTRFADSSFSLSRVCPFSLSLPFSPSFCISLSFLSPDRAFHSKIERQHACRAHFSS